LASRIAIRKGALPIGIFDIIGPVMVGASSSHTAGAVHLGLFARALLDEVPVQADIRLHGSFHYTGEGHGTRLALLAGILGLAPDDERIPDACRLAAACRLTYQFNPIDLGDVHPNSARITLCSPSHTVSIDGSSLGGGKISVWRLNHFPVDLNGIYPTLILVHQDHPGVVAKVTGELAKDGLNIAAMKVYRTHREGDALMCIELDQTPHVKLLETLKGFQNIFDVRFIPKIIKD